MTGGTIAAWVLIALTFCIPLTSSLVRKRRISVLLALWLVIFVHHATSLLNVLGFTIPGAGTDAATFHEMAAFYSQSGSTAPLGIGARMYVWYLSLLYTAFAPSLLLAQTLVVAAFAFAAIIVLKIKDWLDFRSGDVLAVLLFGLQPFMILWTSINLREAYQILFLLLALYYGMQWRVGHRKFAMPLFAASLIGLGLTHNGLAIFAPILFLVLMVWNFRPSQRKRLTVSPSRLVKRVGGVGAAALVMGALFFLPSVGALKAVQSGQALEYAQMYRASSARNVGGSSYISEPDYSSWASFLSAMPAAFAHYFLGPFPWEMRGLISIPAVVATLINIALWIACIAVWRKSSGVTRSQVAFLLTAAFALEALWAAGTTGYGTAMRHHLVVFPVLVAVGGPLITNKVKAFFSV